MLETPEHLREPSITKMVIFFLLLCALALFSCQSDHENGKIPVPADITDDFYVDDLQPVYLDEKESAPPVPGIRFVEEIYLRDSDENNIQNIELLSIANGTFYMFDFVSKSIRLFDSNGRFLSSISHPDFKDKCTPFVIASYSRTLQRVVAAVPGKGLFLFHDSGEIDQVLTFPEIDNLGQNILGVVPSNNGDMLAVTLYERGPYLALVREGSLFRQFYRDRTPPLSKTADFRTNFWPLVFVDSDREGNIYTCERVDYEIRKYNPDGDYIGDFKVLEDSNYAFPPDSLDKERFRIDKEFKETWNNSWTQVDSLGVLNDEYLVACLRIHGQPEFSLHFYSLDGGGCDHPIAWPTRLMCVDEDNRMYFLDDSSAEPFLSVWSLDQGSRTLDAEK